MNSLINSKIPWAVIGGIAARAGALELACIAVGTIACNQNAGIATGFIVAVLYGFTGMIRAAIAYKAIELPTALLPAPAMQKLLTTETKQLTSPIKGLLTVNEDI